MHLKKSIATSKTEPFVALVDGFQALTNATKNFISGVAGVLDPHLEHYKCSKNFVGVQSK